MTTRQRTGKRRNEFPTSGGTGVVPYYPIANATYAGAIDTANTIRAAANVTYRNVYRALQSVTLVKLVFANWYTLYGGGHADTDVVGPTVLRASIEIPGVAIYRILFGGAVEGTMATGDTLTSDPLALAITAGSLFYVRSYVVSGNWVSPRASYGAAGTGGNAAGDLTAPGAGVIADAVAFQHAPIQILGNPTLRRGVLISGDSVASGYGDPTGGECPGFAVGTTAAGGYIDRALTTLTYGRTNIARAGDYARDFKLAAGHARRLAMVTSGNHTHIVLEYGRNDINDGTPIATFANDILAGAAFFPTLKVICPTITPHTTSTDAWATVVNQTVNNAGMEANRVLYNNWVRAGMPVDPALKTYVAVGTGGALLAGQTGHPVASVLEVADSAESARDSGKWNANYTVDGIHPNPAAAAAIAAAVQVPLSAALA